MPPLHQKFLMRALFAQPPFVEDQDPVGILDGAQTMCDHDRGAPGQQAVQGFADHHLGSRIHAGGGFVQNQKARIVRQGAGETHELPLAHRKSRAALADGGIESLRQGIDEWAEADLAQRGVDGGASDAFRAQPHIRFERARE